MGRWIERLPPFPLLVRPLSGGYLGAIGKLEARDDETHRSLRWSREFRQLHQVRYRLPVSVPGLVMSTMPHTAIQLLERTLTSIHGCGPTFERLTRINRYGAKRSGESVTPRSLDLEPATPSHHNGN